MWLTLWVPVPCRIIQGRHMASSQAVKRLRQITLAISFHTDGCLSVRKHKKLLVSRLFWWESYVASMESLTDTGLKTQLKGSIQYEYRNDINHRQSDVHVIFLSFLDGNLLMEGSFFQKYFSKHSKVKIPVKVYYSVHG